MTILSTLIITIYSVARVAAWWADRNIKRKTAPPVFIIRENDPDQQRALVNMIEKGLAGRRS
jgi:hypothetical protein